MVRLTMVLTSHQYIFMKSGITGEQMLKIVKKQHLTLTGISLFKISL